MRSQRFAALEERLIESGVGARQIRRIVRELEDHVDDLCAEARRDGTDRQSALSAAMARIGDQALIADHVVSDPAVRTWVYRYPRLARIYLPFAYVVLLPAWPVFAGIANPGVVLRWATALMLSAGVTAAILLFMQYAIVLG